MFDVMNDTNTMNFNEQNRIFNEEHQRFTSNMLRRNFNNTDNNGKDFQKEYDEANAYIARIQKEINETKKNTVDIKHMQNESDIIDNQNINNTIDDFQKHFKEAQEFIARIQREIDEEKRRRNKQP